jgi:protein TonB
MFEGFEARGDRQSRRRLAASSGLSMAVIALLVIGAVLFASRPREKKKPPPPPPPPVVKPRKPAAARSASAGPPAAPTHIPEGALAEGDASDFRAGASPGIAWGTELGAGGGGGALGTSAAMSPPPAPPPRPAKLRSSGAGLPPGAIPPRPAADNRTPSYPEAMRKKRVEGLVILRVLVGADGRVAELAVVEGEEPFVSAAREVVRSWRYEPALVEGNPIAVHRIIRVPFKLRT